MPFSCSDWARFLLLSGFCFLSQFSSVDLKTLQPTIECSMHRKESSLLLCLHFLSYPLTPLCLSQGSVFVPRVTHKTVKVSWRWPVMCLCLSISGWSCLNGSHYWFTLPSSTDTHTHTHTRTHTQAGFWLPGLLVKHWAGCWGLQMSYYIRCVYQMPVYTFSCPVLSLSFSFLPASNKSVCVSADLCPPIISSLASYFLHTYIKHVDIHLSSATHMFRCQNEKVWICESCAEFFVSQKERVLTHNHLL